jgi:hypothetical protein
VIRFLPPTFEPNKHYGLDVWVHSFVGSGNGSYLCLLKMQNKSCPICRASQECRSRHEEDEAKQLEAKKQVLTWIVDRDGKSKMPQLYAVSWTMDRDIVVLSKDKRKGEALYIDDPDQGYDVSFTRTGTGLNTRYPGLQIDRDPSPISDDPSEQDKILEYVTDNPLPSVLYYCTGDYLAKVMEGTTEEPDQVEERPRRKIFRRDRDEPDQGENEPDEDEAEDATESDEEDDEPEEDEENYSDEMDPLEDEEEEEKPRRRLVRSNR